MSLKVPVTATQTPSGVATWIRKAADAINRMDGSGGASTGGFGGSDGSIGILPMVDGSVPPVFIVNPDGSLIYTEVF